MMERVGCGVQVRVVQAGELVWRSVGFLVDPVISVDEKVVEGKDSTWAYTVFPDLVEKKESWRGGQRINA